jgi:hypothetical protein
MPSDSTLSSFTLWLNWKATDMPGREKPKEDMIVASKETHVERAFISLRLRQLKHRQSSREVNENEGKGDREAVIR